MNTDDQLKLATHALHNIRNNYGKVCQEFEICTHEACTSSSGAWLEANEALLNMNKECLDCVIKNELLVKVTVGDTLVTITSSCQKHPIEAAKLAIIDAGAQEQADKEGWSVSFQPKESI